MIHDGNHSEGFTYDKHGRLVYHEPDGELTTLPAGEPAVQGTADVAITIAVTFIVAVVVCVAVWGRDFIGMVLAAFG